MAKKKIESQEIKEEILSSQMDEVMGDRFAIYAKDVIQNRAIPDCRDGLKPVQRRILFGMWMAGNVHSKPTKKCAHIVGDVMGKYHPHGDSSIYEALVRMSQPWNSRYPLVDFQGNNGSIDGDGAAAYRYTEARLSSLADELLEDLDCDTVDMELTFDDALEEPSVLPAHFPNLFANGAEGIAVGIATNIPPHNLGELAETIAYRISHPDCSIEELMNVLPGPDFPTGGLIYRGEGLKEMYRLGKGRFFMEAKKHYEEVRGHSLIVIDEIPYQINKALLVKSIDKIRHDKEIPGIEEVRDETDKDGMRIVIELRPDADKETIYAYLLQKTDLRTSYSAHVVAISEGRPKTLNLLEYCDAYIQHELEVISRRSKHLLAKDKSRLEIVTGLLRVATDRGLLDEIVEIIKRSADKADAKKNIMAAFHFSEMQTEAIVMMPLHRLSHGDIGTLAKEKDDLNAEISDLESLIQHQERRESRIVKELRRIAKEYGDQRRSEIIEGEVNKETIDKRSLIAEEDVYFVATRHGYMKRSSANSYRSSKGNEGVKPGIKSGDTFIYIGKCTTKDFFLFFTNKGRYSAIPVSEVRSTKWNDEGFHISSLVQLEDGEQLIGGFALEEFRPDVNVVLLTRNGYIERCALSEFALARWSKPSVAIRLPKDGSDSLIAATATSGYDELLVASEEGLMSYYHETDIRLSHVKSGGIVAGRLKGKPFAGFLSFAPEERNRKFVVITDGGHTRVSSLSRYEIGSRMMKPYRLYKDFKQSPQRLLYLDKVGDKAFPFTYDAVTREDHSRIDVSFEDWNLTPEDKYAKSAEGFNRNRHIGMVSLENCTYIDENFLSHQPPAKEEVLDEEEENALTDDGYEQISLWNEGEE